MVFLISDYELFCGLCLVYSKSRSDMRTRILQVVGSGLGSRTKFECFWFNNSAGMFRLNSIAFYDL